MVCVWGREKELAILVELHSSDRFEYLVQYDRRLVGKTSLLLVCSKGHAVIFYTTQTNNDSLIKLEMEFTYFCQFHGHQEGTHFRER